MPCASTTVVQVYVADRLHNPSHLLLRNKVLNDDVAHILAIRIPVLERHHPKEKH